MKVWECKIIIEDGELPPGFDSPPRMAAQQAIEAAGFKVLSNSSGWGGDISESDIEYIKGNHGDTYYAGLVDADCGPKQ